MARTHEGTRKQLEKPAAFSENSVSFEKNAATFLADMVDFMEEGGSK